MQDFARPKLSPWSSPCLVAMKPDGTPRFLTNSQKVNSATVPDSHPQPQMDDCIEDVGNAKFVSKLDLLKGHWQVLLTEKALKISAFVTPDYFLEYTIMAFSMCNAPTTFQRLINTVLSGVPICTAYLDDAVVYTKTWEDTHQPGIHAPFSRQPLRRILKNTTLVGLLSLL